MEAKKRDDFNILELLESFEVFSEFPRELLLEIEKLTSYINFNKGDVILKQGQQNKDLYMMLSGRVKVVVDGEKVTELNSRGDIFGEMSLVSFKEASASVVASEPVEMLKLEGDFFNKEENGDFKSLYFLHKVFSVVLSDKLKKTNDKAKLFEGLVMKLEKYKSQIEQDNIDLEFKVAERTKELEKRSNELLKINATLEQQKMAIAVSKKQIESLYASRDFTFKSLDDLYINHLMPLSQSIGSIKNGPESQKVLKQVKKEILGAIKVIKPISSYYRLEKSMSQQKILLFDGHKKQQVIARMALGGTGALLDIANNLEEAKAFFTEKNHNIVFIDSDQIEFIKFAHAINEKTKFVLMTSSPIKEYLDNILNCSPFPNIISRNTVNRSYTAKNIVTTVTKLSDDNIFGLDKYITWGSDIQSHKVENSASRKSLISTMNNHLRSLGVRNSIVSRLEVISEELLMNAIYDAPVDKNGHSIYNHLDRTIEVKLKEEEQGTLKYATDGNIVALSVEDPFGSLNGETILKYLKSCYEGNAGVFNKNKGGAGRGIHQIVEHSDLIIFNVCKGVKTEVIAIIYLDSKQKVDNQPNFHYFIQT